MSVHQPDCKIKLPRSFSYVNMWVMLAEHWYCSSVFFMHHFLCSQATTKAKTFVLRIQEHPSCSCEVQPNISHKQQQQQQKNKNKKTQQSLAQKEKTKQLKPSSSCLLKSLSCSLPSVNEKDNKRRQGITGKCYFLEGWGMGL